MFTRRNAAIAALCLMPAAAGVAFHSLEYLLSSGVFVVYAFLHGPRWED